MNARLPLAGIFIASLVSSIVVGASTAGTPPLPPPEPASSKTDKRSFTLNHAGEGFADQRWASEDEMNRYFVKRFIDSANFGNARMFSLPMVVIDDGMRLVPSDSGQPGPTSPNALAYRVEDIELIGVAKHPQPVAFVSTRHVRTYENADPKQGATRALTEFELKALEQLQAGPDTAVFEEKDGGRIVVGAIRAREDCLQCHTRYKTGDLLGAFSYRLQRASLMTPERLAALPSLPTPKPVTASPTRPPPKSAPAEHDGIALVISLDRDAFLPTEPLVIKATFRNTSDAPVSLPNNLAMYGDWLLKMQNINTGKVFTAGYYFHGNQTASARAGPPIQPGGILSANATYFRNYCLVEGDLDYDAFQTAAAKVAPSQSGSRAPMMPLPKGTFNVTLNVRFPNEVENASDAVPVWSDQAIVSKPVQITIGSLPADVAGSITGVVVDRFGRPAAQAKLNFHYATELNLGPPAPGSGYARAIANRAAPPTPMPISPDGFYWIYQEAGSPNGVTDENGVFLIPNLSPGTYIVSVNLAPVDLLHVEQIASKQPIEVKAGSETRLMEPIKLDYSPEGL
ncbi:MAG TPA: hypothetical protein VHC95_11960 [Opitutales bacterium]|nr:hypothetical protein [Opitutales bacterium]